HSRQSLLEGGEHEAVVVDDEQTAEGALRGGVPVGRVRRRQRSVGKSHSYLGRNVFSAAAAFTSSCATSRSGRRWARASWRRCSNAISGLRRPRSMRIPTAVLITRFF